MEELKKYILLTILDENYQNIDQSKYQRVINALLNEINKERICLYIMRGIQRKCAILKLAPTDATILNMITTSYCVDRATEYLDFLQNDHEYAHPCEYEALYR